MDYLTKWVEAKATVKNDARTTARFLYEYVFTRYGLPIELVSDQGKHFINEVIEYLLAEFMVIHRRSAPYHPQANGQAESTNKILCTALTKIVEGSCSDWEKKLHNVLWAYRTACKTTIGTTPFNLVFGLDAILPIEFLVPTLHVAKSLDWTGHELSDQIDHLEKLDETSDGGEMSAQSGVPQARAHSLTVVTLNQMGKKGGHHLAFEEKQRKPILSRG